MKIPPPLALLLSKAATVVELILVPIQSLLKKLYTMGIGVDTDIWNLYTIDELKKITAKLFISK